MCGIVGIRGNGDVSLVLSLLEKLEYRGYDSSGIAYINDDKLDVVKRLGKIENLKESIDLSLNVTCAIAHTRWATHGKCIESNAHPFAVGKITLVHNGIIENFLSLKEKLLNVGYEFLSETDSEVAAAYLDYLYKKEGCINKAIVKLFNDLEGSYAFSIIVDDDKDNLYVVKKDSPLVVAQTGSDKFIASDIHALLDVTSSYYVLDDYEFAKVGDELEFFDRNGNNINKELIEYEFDLDISDKGNYEHYMLKEIHEQGKIVKDLFDFYTRNNFKNLDSNIPDLLKYKKIYIVSCGSAYHAGLVLKNVYEKYLNIEVNVYLASEFRYQKLFLNKDSLVILISQSGETADTLKSLVIAKEHGSDTLAIVNVYASSIARLADYVLYTRAGSEIAVATTKGYTSQIMVGLIPIIKLKGLEIINNIDVLMMEVLNRNIYLKIANKLYKEENIFFIGRGVDYALSMEGALKLKEISYIHAESYAAGELKHGTISLIEEGSYVVGIITDENLKDKTISNLKEVVSRGAKVIMIVREDLSSNCDFADEIVKVPNWGIYQSIVTILPLQLIAYETAKLRGCDIDKPKNLAKSVTVE